MPFYINLYKYVNCFSFFFFFDCSLNRGDDFRSTILLLYYIHSDSSKTSQQHKNRVNKNNCGMLKELLILLEFELERFSYWPLALDTFAHLEILFYYIKSHWHAYRIHYIYYTFFVSDIIFALSAQTWKEKFPCERLSKRKNGNDINESFTLLTTNFIEFISTFHFYVSLYSQRKWFSFSVSFIEID